MRRCHVGNGTSAPSQQLWTTLFAAAGALVFFLPKQQSLFVAGEVTVAMGEVPHPCDLRLIKTARIRVYFQALAQCAQDTTSSAAIPPVDKPWTSTEGLRVISCYQLSLRYSMLVYSWFSAWLLVGVCWCSSSSTCRLCKDFYNLNAFPTLWLLPTLYCPGSQKDTRTTHPVNRHGSTPRKVEAEAEGHGNHIFLIQRYPTHWCNTVLASPRQEKPKKDWFFAALCRKSWKSVALRGFCRNMWRDLHWTCITTGVKTSLCHDSSDYDMRTGSGSDKKAWVETAADAVKLGNRQMLLNLA